MSETIQWAALTPEQRNLLIAEKIMGWDATQPCTGTFLPLDPEPDGLYCPKCGAEICWGDDEEHHTPLPPHYSESMDAAWMVLQEIVRRPKQDGAINDAFGKFADAMLYEDNHDAFSEIFPAYQIFSMAAEWTPERICIAALKAVGCEVAQ
jgi:hypothetical protein